MSSIYDRDNARKQQELYTAPVSEITETAERWKQIMAGDGGDGGVLDPEDEQELYTAPGSGITETLEGWQKITAGNGGKGGELDPEDTESEHLGHNPFADRAAIQDAIYKPAEPLIYPNNDVQSFVEGKRSPVQTVSTVIQPGYRVTRYEKKPDQPQQQQMPQVDTSDPINSLANLLVTPAEREAQQQKLLKNKRQMIAWTGLFDGLRQLANLYTASKGANNMQFTDKPYQNIEQSYKDEQQRQDNLFNYRDKYAQTLYTLQRQMDQDKMKREAQKAQIDWYKARENDLKEKRRQADEKNQAYVNYYKALEDKNVEQAAYWKAKAEGYPEELASKIAKNEAQRQKALQSSGGRSSSGGRGNSPYYETVKTEGYDDNGNKVTKTEKRPLKTSGNGKYDKYKNNSAKKNWKKYKKNK